MKNFLIYFSLVFVLFTSTSALAAISMSCDIGDINISISDIKFENGQFSATGFFSVYPRNRSRSLHYRNGDSGSSNALEWTWNGTDKNTLKTPFGDIVLLPVEGAPRIDIAFPAPDYYENGKTVINHNERITQQSCILK